MLNENIKALRVEKGYTQKDLADMLHVTAQAVSRWESGDVEPSVNTIMDMSKIFGVSVDSLLGELKKGEVASADAALNDELVEKIAEKVEAKVEETKKAETKPVLAVCEQCNRPIYKGAEIVRKTRYYGRRSEKYVICTDCESKNKIRAKEYAKSYSAECRKRAYIWGGVSSAAALAVSLIATLSSGADAAVVITLAVASVLLFPFLSCLFLKNNFVGEMVEVIYGWGFVKFPGLIFSLDLDGIIWLLTVKLAFWILGIILAAAAGILATATGLVVSAFVYPFALRKSYVDPEATES